MNILIILAHPDKNSFNHTIAKQTSEALKSLGYKTVFHDLYAEKFNPVLGAQERASDAKLDATIKKHCEELASADGIVVLHPNWWGQPPAILKGWVDRVMRPNLAYKFKESDSGEGIPIGLLKAKTAIVFNTSNTQQERERNHFGDPLETLWKTCIFDLCGVKNFYRKTFSPVITSTQEEREAWLQEVSEIVRSAFLKA
jgi:NAD(P)H dehydrogenase (quinone)